MAKLLREINDPSPNWAEFNAAQNMSAADRLATFPSGVSGLAENQPDEAGSRSGWSRLTRALGVPSQSNAGLTVWTEAQQLIPDARGTR